MVEASSTTTGVWFTNLQQLSSGLQAVNDCHVSMNLHEFAGLPNTSTHLVLQVKERLR
ncbi:MAG: hypothetical protein ACJ8BW_39515 [Ktedonobacteraceae bacterium]